MLSRSTFFSVAACVIAGTATLPCAFAWDYAGHRMVNQAALTALPSEFPAFVREPATAERIAFLAGEPDRWRNAQDLPLKHVNGMDHYLDLEQVPDAGLDPATLPAFRYDFATAFAAGRAAHPEKFPPIDPAKNSDHSREWPGFAPWTIAEYYGKLKSAFSYLKTFEEHGNPEEIQNARENVVMIMGLMGHYVADVAQPLHSTVHHNGWVGPNPRGYTTWPGIHQWIDGGLIAKTSLTVADFSSQVVAAQPLSLAPRPDARDPIFVQMVDYVIAENAKVEPLYQLEKAGKLGPNAADLSEGKAFVEHQLAEGAHMLSSLWLTAWKAAPIDTFLRANLLKRKGLPVPDTHAK